MARRPRKPPLEPDYPKPLARSLAVTRGFLIGCATMLVFGTILGVVSSGFHTKGPGQVFGLLFCTWGAVGIVICLWLHWIYTRTARRAEAIFSGEKRLAQWTVSPEEQDRYLAVSITRANKTRRALGIIFGASVGVCGTIVLIALVTSKTPIHFATIPIVLVVMGATLLGLFGFAWLVMIYLPIRSLRHPTTRAVFIGIGGVIANGKFSSWELLGASLLGVTYEPADPGTITFRWWQPGAGPYGLPADVSVDVPVPKSRDHDAYQVVEYFKTQFAGQTPPPGVP
jgi:hypothetical protein